MTAERNNPTMNTTIEDGFGSEWTKCGIARCGLHVVRPGKVQCWCDDVSTQGAVTIVWDVVPEIMPAPQGVQAVTPRDHPFRIGVLGRNEQEAREKFKYSLLMWKGLHERSQEEHRPVSVQTPDPPTAERNNPR